MIIVVASFKSVTLPLFQLFKRGSLKAEVRAAKSFILGYQKLKPPHLPDEFSF